MIEKFLLALEGVPKEAQETPGAFALSQPYGMADRVRKALGIQGKQSKGLPGLVGTVGTGLNTGTATGMPKGMGKVAPAQPAQTSSVGMKTGQAGPLGTPPSMKALLGGTKPVKPKMEICQKPSPMKPENVSLGSAFPGPQDLMVALGYGPELETAALLSKEGSERRVLRTLAALDELEAAKTAQEKVPALLKLAELRQEAFSAAAVRMSLL